MKTPKFKIHLNRELGKKYYSERDYISDMKKAGLEPYDPSSIKKHESKPYERSDWAREMQRTAIESKGKVGDRFYQELDKRGYNQKRYMEAVKLATQTR